MKVNTKKLVIAAMLLAVGILLPSVFTGGIQALGQKLSPMHIPVLICGFALGAPWGALVGALTPILRSAFFAMPPIFPMAVSMMCEMAAYGALSGLLFNMLSKKAPNLYVRTYISLIVAMFAGRIVYGIAMALCLMSNGNSYSFSAFISGAFINALPGIALHLVLIPAIVIALVKAKQLPVK